LAGADFTKKALLAATLLVSVRLLPPSTFGDYMFLLSFYQVFSVLAGAGIATILVREVAQKGSDQPGLILGAALSRLAYIVPTAIVMYLAMIAARYPARYYGPLLMMVALLGTRGFSENLIAIFQGDHDQISCGKVGVVQSVVTLGAVAVVCVTSKQLIHILAGHVVGAIVSGVYGFVLLVRSRRRSLESGFAAGFRTASFLLKDGLWMNCGSFLSSAYNRVDVLLLRRFATSEAVAMYTAPYRLLDITQIIPASVMGVLLPRFCHDDLATRLPEKKILRLLLVLAFALVVTVTLAGGWIVLVLLGNKYRDSAPVLRILVWAAVPMYWNFYLNSRLIAYRLEKLMTGAAVLALLLNISLNLLLIPRFGLYACAVVTVVTEFGLLGVNLFFLAKHHDLGMPEYSWRLGMAGFLLFAFFLSWTRGTVATRWMGLALLLAGSAVLPIFRSDFATGFWRKEA